MINKYDLSHPGANQRAETPVGESWPPGAGAGVVNLQEVRSTPPPQAKVLKLMHLSFNLQYYTE